MTLFIDVENKKLVQSLTSDRGVPAPVFMQGDNEPLEIFLLQKGGESLYQVKPLVVGTDFLRVAIARFKGYPKSLTYASGYALNPNGGAEVVLPLNTTAIENAVQESEYITAFLEVEYSDTAGRIITILQTACRIKNDLIENAPTIELQEQFYDRVYTDTVFSKKSANLSDLTDKSASRKNLDVYAKGEVYNKSQIDTQESKNLKKASNLADVADKTAARTNLDVPQKRDLFKYMKCGIWSDTSLSVPSEYGATLGDDFAAGNCSTFLTVYLPEPTSYYTQLYSIAYADSGMFTPEISADGKMLKLGYIYQESESGGTETVEKTAAISKAIEYGMIPDELSITGTSSFLGWKGLKQVMAYSNSLLLPLTASEGKTAKINYSIEDFANGNFPPKGILNSRYHYFRSTFASSFTRNSSHSKGVGGAEIGGKKNVLKISLVPDTYNASHEYELPTKYFSGNGMLHKIKFSIYLPTTNPNITKVQLRLGSIAPTSAGTIVSKTDNIDKSGVILPKDEWQTVEMILTLKWSGAFKLYLYKGNNSYFKLEEESTDAVYLHSITCSCLQGFEGFFYGAGNSGFWKNHGASNRDLAYYGWSLPSEGNGSYTKHIAVSSFSSTTYLYAEGFPSGLELSQIVLRFDSELPDTSSAEDEIQKNVFRLRTNDDTVCEEQLPAIPANIPYYIYPKRGFPELYYSLEIAPMYACNCGGSVDLIFTKVS